MRRKGAFPSVLMALTAGLALVAAPVMAAAPQKRLVLIDQDGSGPGGSNQMSMMVLLQSPDVEVLGITMVTGNAWRDEEAQHTLRMLELIGRTDVPVALGAVFPLIRTEEETRLAAALVGQVAWLGAWGQKLPTLGDGGGGVTAGGGAGAPASAAAGMGAAGGTDASPARPALPGPYDIPPLPEGQPHTVPIAEDAAHFMIRQVHAHPHQVTVYAAGPLTNVAIAVAIDDVEGRNLEAAKRGLIVREIRRGLHLPILFESLGPIQARHPQSDRGARAFGDNRTLNGRAHVHGLDIEAAIRAAHLQWDVTHLEG